MPKNFIIIIFCALTTLLSGQTTNDISAIGERVYAKIQEAGLVEKMIPFDDPRRMNWSTSSEYKKGVSLETLSSINSEYEEMINATLSTSAQEQFYAVVNSKTKDDFFLCIYDQPSQTERWAYSIEGPFTSINITIKGSNFSYTPYAIGLDSVNVNIPDSIDVFSTETGIPRDFIGLLSDSKKRRISGGRIYYNDINENAQFFMTMVLSVGIGKVHEELSEPIFKRIGNYRENELGFSSSKNDTLSGTLSYTTFLPTITHRFVKYGGQNSSCLSTLKEQRYDFGQKFAPPEREIPIVKTVLLCLALVGIGLVIHRYQKIKNENEKLMRR